jgi:GNAT superfamily N-acetyltransferase
VRIELLSDQQVLAIADLLEEARDELVERRGGPELVAETLGSQRVDSLEATRALLGQLADVAVLVTKDGVTVALGLARLDGSQGHLMIYVRPQGRSEGRGTKLFAEVLDLARNYGAQAFDVLVLPGDRPMKQICEKAGLKARKLTMALNDAPLARGDEVVAEES